MNTDSMRLRINAGAPDTIPSPPPGAACKRLLHHLLDELLDAGDGVSHDEASAFVTLVRLAKGGAR